MKNKKVFEILKVVISVAFFIANMIIGGYAAITWVEFEFMDFFFRLLILMIGVCAINIISIIWHELGHLLFGIKAKLEFVSFSVLNFIITKKNNKLRISKAPTINGVAGACNMTFEINKKYDKNSIVLYFLGGILFNFILVIIFSILLIFTNNTNLKIIEIVFISTNLYYALINSLPVIHKSGLNVDMLHIVNCFKDSEYINVFARASKIQNLLSNGCELKDIDENLFYMPTDFSSYSKVSMAQLYCDYIAEKGQYKEAIENIKVLLEKTKGKLSKATLNLLKISMIQYIFEGNFDVEKISDYWDKDVKKYLELMGDFEPQLIGINYMCVSLIEKDVKKAQKYLEKFEKIKKNHHNKNSINETEKMIAKVKERIVAI